MTVKHDATMPPPQGQLIGGRYRLGPVIGRGGMATIHRALDERVGRQVAVKLLRPEVARDVDLAHRFRREALAATVLRHPNIVACLDTGTDGQQPYLVMDLVDGEDLAARLRRGGRLAPWQAARIGLDVARALGVAHLRGIVHRDIKPGNILLASDGRALVADFGIARLAADAEAALPGTTLGSVHYFSPEQARGVTTTPASDVYCLGLVLFEALTGSRAWRGDTTDAIALARVDAPAPSPRAQRPEVPEELDAVVRRALAPQASDRYPNGAAMGFALEPIVSAGDRSSLTTVVPIPKATAAADYDLAVAQGAPAAPARPARSRSGRSPRDLHGARSNPRRADRPLVAMPRLVGRTPRSSVLVALLAILGVVAGALLVAALPGSGADVPSGDPAGNPVAIASPTAEPTATPTPRPTSRPTPTPKPTAAPTPTPPPVPAGEVADLCEIFFDIPCGLGAGRYAPSRFRPEFDVELGDGWSNAAHQADIVALRRAEGTMTFASEIATVFPDGQATEPRQRVQDLIEAFIATPGVSATKPADIKIDKRKGTSIDVTPTGPDRVQLFATDGSTFYIEPDVSTRIVVIDVRDRVVVLAIEPEVGVDLRDLLATADPAAGTIRWR